MSERQDSAVILGVYGKGNVGDEALLDVVASELRQVLPGCEIYVFCSGPAAVQRRFDVAALTRTPATELWRKIGIVRRSRIVVVGGGTLLCDHGGGLKDAAAVATYFFWLFVARLFGVPTVLYAQGFGPARGRLIRFGLWLVGLLSTRVTVRDGASYDLLTAIAGRQPKFSLGADPVAAADRYLPAAVRQRANPALVHRIQALRPFILLAIRYPKLDSLESSRERLEAAGATAAELCKRTGVNVVLFPTHLSDEFVDDKPVMDLLEPLLVAHDIPRGRIVRALWESLDDAAVWVQSAEMVFGDRLHALLVASLNHVPVAGVVVEDKISGCLEDVFRGEPVAGIVAQGNVAAGATQRLLEDLWDRRGAEPALYARLLADYRARRDVNINALEQALGAHRRSRGARARI